MKVTLIREISGAELINDLEKTYGSIDKLETLHNRNPENMKIYMDLDDWKYYSNNLEEIIQDSKTIITEKLTLGKLEMELLNFIKTRNPQSIRELARMIHKDIKTVHPKVKNLEKEGLIEFKKGPKNKKIPVMNYDKIEISV
jgi:predicted HTH transcriptional regulator